jgi:Cu/Ag efflux protein CusF
MFRTEIVIAALVSISAAAVPARAQDQKTSTREMMSLTARVERVDRFSRSLTLKTPEGLIHTVYFGPELKTFDEVQSGDTVTVRIVDFYIVAVNPNAKPTVITDTTAEAKKENDKSSSDVQQQLKATVTIESVDRQTNLVVYKTGDNRRNMRQVLDGHLLDGLKPGDVVEVTYTRERALELIRNP